MSRRYITLLIRAETSLLIVVDFNLEVACRFRVRFQPVKTRGLHRCNPVVKTTFAFDPVLDPDNALAFEVEIEKMS